MPFLAATDQLPEWQRAAFGGETTTWLTRAAGEERADPAQRQHERCIGRLNAVERLMTFACMRFFCWAPAEARRT
jgi:hypothetical protein